MVCWVASFKTSFEKACNSGKHSVTYSEREVKEMDKQIAEQKFFTYTPKRPLVLKDLDTKGGPALNLEKKALNVALTYYADFLAGKRDFADDEKSPFTEDHVADDDLFEDEFDEALDV
jgi:hypothetical protein